MQLIALVGDPAASPRRGRSEQAARNARIGLPDSWHSGRLDNLWPRLKLAEALHALSSRAAASRRSIPRLYREIRDVREYFEADVLMHFPAVPASRHPVLGKSRKAIAR